jgi:serine/threonine protein kinase
MDFVCKLADFELGMTLEQSMLPLPEHKGGPASKPRMRFEGTPAYLAPEIIVAFLQQRTTPATFASDIYSVGIALNEIASNEVPYANARLSEEKWQQNTVIESRYPQYPYVVNPVWKK